MFQYVLCNIPGPTTSRHKFSEQNLGCDCVGVTSCDADCSCIIRYGQTYNKQGILMIEDAHKSYHQPVLECNRQCRCSAKCNNRMVQNGVQIQLQVFSTEKKGFGVRTLEDIPKDAFVCEYAGEVLDYETACSRTVVLSQSTSSNYYIFALKEHLGSGETLNTYIDPMYVGNVGRFINHSCEPNLYMVPVRINNSIPHLALYAYHDIPAEEELSFDYSGVCSQENGIDNIIDDSDMEDINSVPTVSVNEDTKTQDLSRQQCHCESARCRSFLPFDRSLFKGT